MGEERLHWSEKAKLTPPSTYSPGSLQPQPQPPRSRRTAVLAIGSVLVVVTIIVVAVFVMLPSRSGKMASVTPTMPSTIGSTVTTAPLSSTTTTSTTEPRQESPVTSIYSQAGVFRESTFGISFAYPKSWMSYNVDDILDSDSPPAVAMEVADPKGAEYAGTPADYLLFMAGAMTDEFAASSAKAQLEEAMVYWQDNTIGAESAKTVQEVKSIKVNGMDGAETTLELKADGHTMRARICYVHSGLLSCLFVMCSDLKNQEKNWALFETTLKSLQLGVATTHI
jgi:hypothetical protein